jgi:hypothetical protein
MWLPKSLGAGLFNLDYSMRPVLDQANGIFSRVTHLMLASPCQKLFSPNLKLPGLNKCNQRAVLF